MLFRSALTIATIITIITTTNKIVTQQALYGAILKSLTHPPTHTHTLTRSLTHPPTHSPTHSLNLA